MFRQEIPPQTLAIRAHREYATALHISLLLMRCGARVVPTASIEPVKVTTP